MGFRLFLHIFAVLFAAPAGAGESLNRFHESTQARMKVESNDSLEAAFYYETLPGDSSETYAIGVPFLIPITDVASYLQVYKVFRASLGLQNGLDPGAPANATSFSDSLNLLRSQTLGLKTEQRILLLSMIGAELAFGYGETNSSGDALSFEEIFQNAEANGHRGGVCTDIASYLNEVQKAIGFRNVGMHEMVVPGEGGAGAVGHALAQFQDPVTHEYYVQNYSIILNTHRTTLTSAIDVSSHLFGLLNGAELIESQKGRVHLYVPHTTRWVAKVLRGEVNGNPTKTIAYVKTSPIEQYLVLQTSSDKNEVKGFAIHSSRKEANGNYQVDAVGIAGTMSDREVFDKKGDEETGYRASGRMGVSNTVIPSTYDSENLKIGNTSRANPFVLTDIEAYAKQNSVKLSATWEMESVGAGSGLDEGTLYINRVWQQFGIGADYFFGKNSPFSLGVKRYFDFVPDSLTGRSIRFDTTKDVLHLVFDTRRGANQAYVVVGQEVYLFEGVEKMSALGLRNYFKATLPAGNLGEFYILADLNGIPKNKSGDPFYEADRFFGLSQGWKKTVRENIEIGTDLNWSNQGIPFFEFNRSPATAAPPVKPDAINGDLWIKFSF